MPDFLQSLPDWLASHPQWLGLAIALIALLECTALIGVLWPGVILLFSAALLAGQSGMGLLPLFLLCWSGTLLGNLLSYLLGRRLQHQSRKLPLLRSHPHWLSQAELQLEHYGSASLFIGHFIGPVRPVLPILAGMLRLNWRTFAGIILPTSAFWSFTSVLPGWLVGTALDSSPPEGFWLRAACIVLPLTVLALLALSLVRKHHPARHQIIATLGLLALLPMLLAWRWFQPMDSYLTERMLALRLQLPETTDIALLLTQLGDVRLQALLGGLLCLLLLAYKNYRALWLVLVTLPGAVLINAALKELLTRPRPDILSTLDGFSLPSGHSLRSMMLLLILALLVANGRRYAVRVLLVTGALLTGLLVALSRVYLTAHWLTDTLSSILLAIVCCTASLALAQRKQPLPALPGHFLPLYLASAATVYVVFVLLTLSAAHLKYQLPL